MKRTNDFQPIRSEGGLLPPDVMRRVLDPREKLPGTLPEDYGLPMGERLNEVITQSWNRMRKHWAEFRAAVEASSPDHSLLTTRHSPCFSLDPSLFFCQQFAKVALFYLNSLTFPGPLGIMLFKVLALVGVSLFDPEPSLRSRRRETRRPWIKID